MTASATVMEASPVRMLLGSGPAVALPVERWLSRPGPVELRVLDRALPPILDVGCGPGRVAQAAAERGWPSLGIDTAPSAVGMGRARGTTILERSVFGPVPGAGRWGTALLLDGSIGIGGDPGRLLDRVGALVRSEGLVLAEVEAPGVPATPLRARIAAGGWAGPWFDWARVGADAMFCLARSSCLRLDDLWEEADGRWFAEMTRP